jgi:nicotinamidase-related amidase
MKEAFGLSFPEGLQEICTPERCALVIYDMQVGIVSQIAEGNEIVMRCRELLEAARKGGFRCFFARHLFLPNRAAGMGQLRRAMIWQGKSEPAETRPFITHGSPAFEIVPELKPEEGEVVIDKITMSAFEGTFLNLAMRDARLDAMVIAGIALEIGIEPTVRHALDLNYVPVMATDACGSKTQELKTRSLATLAETGEVLPASTADVVSAMVRHSR